MSKKTPKEQQKAEDQLLVHARWIAERFERMNEQLITLSGTFIGFLAVELGLLAQIPHEKIHTQKVTYWIGVVTLLAIAGSILLFFFALISKEFLLPRLEDIQDSIELDSKQMSREPLRMMVSTKKRNRNIQQSLESENIHLNGFYTPALIVGGIAQALVVLLIIRIWTFG